MGTFEVQIGVGHPAGGDFNAISATVDTGARHSMMPGTLLERYGYGLSRPGGTALLMGALLSMAWQMPGSV